jgi:hypothetical protein
MKKLGFLIGEWAGEGRMLLASGEWIEFSQTERAEYKLDGLLLVIEGVGRAKSDGRPLLQAYGIASYDDATGTNGIVLRQAWGQAMQTLGKPADLSASAIVIFNIWGFLLGIAAVWIYAAIRPRYGAGPRTAVRAGLVAWVLAVFLANLGNYALGLFPTRLLVITTVVALAEIVAGTLAGAWLYKEKEMEAPAVLRPAA